MGKSQNDLSESLLASFNAKSKLTEKPPQKPVEAQSAQKTPQPARRLKSAPEGLKTAANANLSKALRSTISYQRTEATAADDILEVLRTTKGVRGSFSDAVKIALRLCPLDEKSIQEAWEATKLEDGRVLRHKE